MRPPILLLFLLGVTGCEALEEGERTPAYTPPHERAKPLGATDPAGRLQPGMAEPIERRGPRPPVAGAVNVDHLIQPGELHFKHLWLVAEGGENAEAYWSFSGDRMILQRREPEVGVDCEQIYVTGPELALDMVSTGGGVTTCSYFLPSDQQVLFASTHAEHETCPPPPDASQGQVWPLHPEFDIYVRDLRDNSLTAIVANPGYDAEGTVSPIGDRMVFTSTRSGDAELWTCALDGSDLRQVTDEPGYDGGAFFSYKGDMLVWRATAFTSGLETQEQREYFDLLGKNVVKPARMELFVSRADGSERRQVTYLGRANLAPHFFPDDSRILFSTNHHDTSRRGGNFELFAVDLDGGNLEQVTFYNEAEGKQFDGSPMFSPDGRYLAFTSNRGDREAGETSVYVAEWR